MDDAVELVLETKIILLNLASLSIQDSCTVETTRSSSRARRTNVGSSKDYGTNNAVESPSNSEGHRQRAMWMEQREASEAPPQTQGDMISREWSKAQHLSLDWSDRIGGNIALFKLLILYAR